MNYDYNSSVNWANAGNQYENNHWYNLYLGSLNSYIFNANYTNDLVNRYNAILSSYDSEVHAITGGQQISNNLQPVNTQPPSGK